MATSELSFGGITANEVYGTLKTARINDDDARRFVAGWVWENAYGLGRTFAYTHPLSVTDPAGPPVPFAREFAHTDWLDGESAVQAGETPTEEGFNLRFHKIEHDLDRLGVLGAQLAASTAAMRATIAAALEEIHAELNRINADVASLKAGRGSSTVPGPVKFDPGIKFVGATQYFNKPVQIWQTENGQMLALPTVNPVSVPQAAVSRAPEVGEILTRDPDIGAVFHNPVSVGDLITNFGDRRATDGRPLADLLSALPPAATFASPDALVAELADRDAALMRGTGADVVARSELGVPAGSAANAPVDRLEGVNAAMTNALNAANVNNLGDLGAMSSQNLLITLAARNITISAGQASAIIAKARTFRQL
jgi:hypothetical protein